MQGCSPSPGDDADMVRASRPGQCEWNCDVSVRNHRHASSPSNRALNLAWKFIFFPWQQRARAGVEIVVLESTTVALVVRAWPLSRLAALRLLPYTQRYRLPSPPR
jgi:TspO/MBR family